MASRSPRGQWVNSITSLFLVTMMTSRLWDTFCIPDLCKSAVVCPHKCQAMCSFYVLLLLAWGRFWKNTSRVVGDFRHLWMFMWHHCNCDADNGLPPQWREIICYAQKKTNNCLYHSVDRWNLMFRLIHCVVLRCVTLYCIVVHLQNKYGRRMSTKWSLHVWADWVTIG